MKRNNYKFELFISLGCFILAFIFAVIWNTRQENEISKEISSHVLRFHILANSDKKYDQQLKLEVRDLILNILNDNLGENATKEDISKYIMNHKKELEIAAVQYIHSKGFDYGVDMTVTKSAFPNRNYGSIIFPKGTYDAVKVIIGSGNGHNWWCVIYPALCFIDSTYAVVPDSSTDVLKETLGESSYYALLSPETKFEYKSRLLELIYD